VSQPKRYDFGLTVESCPTTGFHETRPLVSESESGLFVKYADYAALQAEVAELKELVEFLSQADSYLQSANQNAEMERCIQLELENERLRKAGRGLRAIAEGTYCVTQPEPVKEWDAIDGDAWHAAKGVES
jgi:hypothetical protein